MSLQLNKVEEAIEDIRKGKIVLVFDDIARENEGDFIAAADLVTPSVINFMAKYGRGLICVAITQERSDELALERMVQSNTALMATNFTVSVDLKGHGCTTGISAHDRAKTVRALVDKAIKPENLARPGHIFPLIAHPKGVLGRMGHTEASVDLPLLAGLNPCGVLVEVMNDDGTMARWDDLVKVAQHHSIKLISITQLAEYRKQYNK
ncbi:3,4-dihydroxy-2-butanone-4-phosphate synthase [Microbacter margulisiae]|uniref:3,4-dihydroxy-2-butanone 4-phosphate synthase n=1 Tax=Microbacter margulisiae TaxID=1350067 RepID=A0A7W5H2J4_9PORP|nr:3,4-dihydroxy-2-butanone-4-phosphate synthase [Microbacter margulisiae]MBB3188763.1 3,4-dihydroxy-2-butanone 4-phosphate synthase [Microbacter margulisiae]